MKPDSTKKEAIERFQQLDEQLRVIENGAKVVEGGLRNSNKVRRGQGECVRYRSDGRAHNKGL